MENVVHNQGKLVYHYTSLNAFMSIMGGQEQSEMHFHANGLHCMNDSSEFKYGLKELRRVLPLIEKKIGGIRDDLKLSDIINAEDCSVCGRWNDKYASILLEANKTPFIISTSSKGDDIPMWAMYGDDGCGLSIGLDIANIFRPIKMQDGSAAHNKMFCNIEDIHALKIVKQLSLCHPAVLNIKRTYCEYVSKAEQLTEKELEILKVQTIYYIVVLAAALVKHPAFMFEHEWRILSIPERTKDIRYRVNSKGVVMPYTIMRIPYSSLKRIIIGPCCNGPYQQSQIIRYLTSKGITHCKVSISKMPFVG